MSTSSVDGLVSGLQTSTMISQLMKVEAAPQDRLKSKVTTAQTAVASYMSVNSKISAIKSAGDAMGDLTNWRSLKVASSSTTVTATASASMSAATGSLTFNVTSVAAKQSTTMPVITYADDNHDGTTDTTPHKITNVNTIQVQPGTYDANGVFTPVGSPKPVDISKDKSAAGIAGAINSANVGAVAYVMKTSDTTGVLQVNGAKSGANNGFQIYGLDGSALNNNESFSTTPPKSAAVDVVGGGGQTYTVTSDSNTFTGLMTGVTVTVTKAPDNGVTINAETDTDAIADKFSALVDAANAALTEIGTQTAYDASSKTGAPLSGDFAVRDLSQKILSAFSTAFSYDDPNSTTDPKAQINFGTLKKFGIQLNKDGTQIEFKKSTFTDAYAKDPGSIQQAGIALGDKFEALGTKMNGSLSSVMLGRNTEISYLNDQISDWDVRLVAKRQALQKQYADLESALGKLKNQSNWLSGQLSGLS